jgi:hypothetical protein
VKREAASAKFPRAPRGGRPLASGKPQITAATLVALVGGVQVAMLLL